MQILIMRHGEAANIAGEDSLRPLTKQGNLEAEKMGLWLARSKLKLNYVFVSPYRRAQQTCKKITAVLTKKVLFNDKAPETLNFITPSGNASQVHDFIDGLFQSDNALINDNGVDDNQAILFVSHMPFVSYLIAELTASHNTPIFSTGAIAIIDYDIKLMKGQLVDLITPEKVHY